MLSDYFSSERCADVREMRRTTGVSAVRRAQLTGSEMREDEGPGGKLHTVYKAPRRPPHTRAPRPPPPATRRSFRQVRSKIGPFECTCFRRFSEFLSLHAELKQNFKKGPVPSGKKLRESKWEMRPERHIEARIRLLQTYCDQLCAAPEIAQSDLVISFFWPSGSRGDGVVNAPDGSTASMT